MFFLAFFRIISGNLFSSHFLDSKLSVSYSDFSLTWRLIGNSLPHNFKASIDDMSDWALCDSDLKETVGQVFLSLTFAEPILGSCRQIVGSYPSRASIDLGYVCDNVSLPWFGMRRLLLIKLLIVVGMVFCMTRMKRILQSLFSSGTDGIFWTSARDEDQNWLQQPSANFSKEWVGFASLVGVNWTNLDFSD